MCMKYSNEMREKKTVQTHFTKAKAIEIRNILMVPHGQMSKDKFSLQSNRHFNFEYFEFYFYAKKLCIRLWKMTFGQHAIVCNKFES